MTEREGQGRDPEVDRALGALDGTPEAPPIGETLSRELERMAAAQPRAPRRQLAGVVGASLCYASFLVIVAGVRRDLGALPIAWVLAFAGLWLVSFAAITYLVVVPPRGQVMPRWRAAAVLSALSAVAFIAAGLFLSESVPGMSTTYEVTAARVLERAGSCMGLGMVSILVPVVLAALAVRGSLPVGARSAAVALGAAGGALGGLVLHLHCPIAERFHVGLVHGGVVVLAALFTALASAAYSGARDRTERK